MKRFVSMVFSALCAVSALRAQTGGQLYLVTGLATPQGNFTVPSGVYSVDQDNGTARPVAQLVAGSEGSDSVQVDHDRRLIVIATPIVKPSRLIVLSMDAPSMPRSIPTAYGDDALIRNFLFQTRDGRLIEAFHVGPFAYRLLGFDLLALDPNAAARELSWDDYRYVRREGVWPPGDDTRVQVFQTGGRLVLDPNKGIADLGVSLPSGITRDRDEALLLDVNNDEMLVINKTKVPGKETVGQGGATELLVFDKKAQRWSTLRVPGAGSSVRGFGHWLALAHADVQRTWDAYLRNDLRNQRESPGSERRQTQLRSGSREQDGGNATVDGLFRGSLYYYPGTLYLVDIRSQRRLEIKTDQGDSEVLLVDGDSVYYRVNQNLYSAILDTSDIRDSKLILSDEIVQLSHWAFNGPATSR